MLPQIESLSQFYTSNKELIEKQINSCVELGRNGSREDLFYDLAYCLCTPQNDARHVVKAINTLKEKQVLSADDEELLAFYLRKEKVRFHNNKASYILSAKKRFIGENCERDIREYVNYLLSLSQIEARNELWVRNIKGLGMKESSHFLRNIGHGSDLALLDLHVLSLLYGHNVITNIPRSLTSSKYLEIEEKMRNWSKQIGIPMGDLDFVIWGMATGWVYK